MRRFSVIVVLFICATIFSVMIGTAAELKIDGGVLQVFHMDVNIEIPRISAEVDIKPESLQKKSAGQAVTVFIELPQGYDVADIDVATIRLCLGTAPCDGGVAPDGAPGAKPKMGDHDGDGVSDLKVTFDRASVVALVGNVQPPATITFTVSGKVASCIFAGSDTVRLIDPT